MHDQRCPEAVDEADHETTSLAHRTALDNELNQPSSPKPVASLSKPLGAVVNERPLPNYKFVGREKELEAIRKALV